MNTTDPVELIVAAALTKAGIAFTHESDNKRQSLDFRSDLRILGHRIILLCGWLADPFGDTVGDEIARMLKRDDARAVARRCFIADRQHRAAAM